MRNLLKNKHGNVGALGVVIAGLVAIVIGVLIWFKVDAAMVSAGYSSLPSGGKAAWNSTNTTANTVWTLMPIIAIVVIAGIILAIVMNFGREKF